MEYLGYIIDNLSIGSEKNKKNYEKKVRKNDNLSIGSEKNKNNDEEKVISMQW